MILMQGDKEGLKTLEKRVWRVKIRSIQTGQDKYGFRMNERIRTENKKHMYITERKKKQKVKWIGDV